MKTFAYHMKKFQGGFLAFAIFAMMVRTASALPSDPTSWKALVEGGAQIEIAQEVAAPPLLDGQDTNALRITVQQTGERFGIVCADMGKTKLQTGEWYDFAFDARTDTRKTFALTVSLESPDGKKVFARTTLPEVGRTSWAHYTVALHVRQPASKYRMVITLADTGTIWLNDLSVILRKPTETH